MSKQKIHLHSMMVHSIAALAPLAAVAYIFLKLQVSFLSIDGKSWAFLVVLSTILIFLITLPSILSGIFERNHAYAKWHSTHKIKLWLSAAFVGILIVELLLLSGGGINGPLFSPLGILIIFGNNIVTFYLCKYGLKITLGRQSIGRALHEPDLFKKEPVDILVMAGELKKEEPKYLDLLKER